MAHVQFRTGDAATNEFGVQLLVDGVDITMHVVADSLSIDPGDVAADRSPTVSFSLFVDDGLEVDLPDAVLRAIDVKTVE